MQFSIIVPMYNVEKYIDKCIKSIISQSYKDFEVIIVNDCSSDNSLQIAKLWQSKSDKIQIIDKEMNSGLSETRNKGIIQARGNYFLFVDSDDYIESDTLEEFNRIIEQYKPDIIYGGVIQKYESGRTLYKYGFVSKPDTLYISKDYMKIELKHRNLFAMAQCGIYRRELIIKNNLFFKSAILHEDEEWTPRVLMNANSIYLSKKYFYYYLKREGSITTKKDRTKNGIDLLQTCLELENYANQNLKNSELLRLYYNQLAKLYMKGTCIGKLYRKEYKKIVNRLFPLKHACQPFDILKAILFAISLNVYAKFDSIFGDNWR